MVYTQIDRHLQDRFFFFHRSPGDAPRVGESETARTRIPTVGVCGDFMGFKSPMVIIYMVLFIYGIYDDTYIYIYIYTFMVTFIGF